MTDSYFAVRGRLREVRQAVRQSENLTRSSSKDDLVFRFLVDLARSIEPTGTKREDLVHYIFRCMADVARHHAAEAYEDYGLDNPFKKSSSTPLKRHFTWPVINEAPVRRSGSTTPIWIYQEFSALKMFGYTVGKTKGWERAKRQRFLSDFIELELPGIVSDTFGDEYGNPRTMKRLLKVANVIAGVANLRIRADAHAYREAIQDWMDDLNFLEERYLAGRGISAICWPTIPAHRASS